MLDTETSASLCPCCLCAAASSSSCDATPTFTEVPPSCAAPNMFRRSEKCRCPLAKRHKIMNCYAVMFLLCPSSLAIHSGKKSIHHHRATPPFSVCRPTPRSQQKKTMVCTIFLGKQGIGPERRVYTIEASDPGQKNRLFFFVFRLR